MELVLRLATAACLLLALTRRRWAYMLFVVLALLALPAQAGFHLRPPRCELFVGPRLAFSSFGNVPHLILFALLFLLTRRQLSGSAASGQAAILTIVIGALLELAEGVSGQHHCRLRDLLPDAGGVALGWIALVTAHRLLRRRATREAPS